MARTMRVLRRLSPLLLAVGLLIIFAVFFWSFRLAKDFTGRYETDSFHRHFWNLFSIGGCACLAGCLGLGATIKSRAAITMGIIALASGFGLTILLMPFVDFEGWTGASAYTLVGIVFAGAIVLLVLGGFRWLLQRFWASGEPNSP
jgi:hypothetical protein